MFVRYSVVLSALFVSVVASAASSFFDPSFSLDRLVDELRSEPKAAARSFRPLAENEVTLATITSDALPGEKLLMNFTLDADHQVTAVHRVSSRGNEHVYTLDQLAQGVVMLESDGREVVRLTFKNFRAHDGGDGVLRYLVSGISGTYASFTMNIVREADVWKAYTVVNGKRIAFTKMFLRKNTFFGKTIGIAGVEVK